MRRFSLALFVTLAALASCSIEGTRQLGDACITTRECAAGLVCEFNALGNSQCVRSAVFDASAIDVVRPVDTAPADTTPADTTPADTPPTDTGVDVVTDVPPEAAQPTDVPMDVPVDVPARDVPVDAGADVPDVSDALDVIDAADVTDARAADAGDVEDDRPDAASDGG